MATMTWTGRRSSTGLRRRPSRSAAPECGRGWHAHRQNEGIRGAGGLGVPRPPVWHEGPHAPSRTGPPRRSSSGPSKPWPSRGAGRLPCGGPRPSRPGAGRGLRAAQPAPSRARPAGDDHRDTLRRASSCPSESSKSLDTAQRPVYAVPGQRLVEGPALDDAPTVCRGDGYDQGRAR